MNHTTRKSELYFEELGEDFNKFMSSYDVKQRTRLIKRFLSRVDLRGRALEVGCGTGAITPVLLNTNLSITVGDISKQLAVETAERIGCEAIECDATDISFEQEAFNLVLSSEVIEHVPDPRRALREMARVVSKGGVVIVTSPNKLWYPLLWLSQKLGLRKFSGNEIWLWPTEARTILRQEGLEVLAIEGCHLFPWQIPFAQMFLPFFDRLGHLLWPLMINWGILATKR